MKPFDILKHPHISEVSSVKDNYVLINNDEDKLSFDELCEYCKYINDEGRFEEIIKGLDKTEFIARARFLGWICYQMGAGQEYNIEPTKDQLDSLINGVLFGLNNPDATPEENHISWMNSKISQGWVYGEVKDMEKKTHPDLVPFDELTKVEKDKDIMDCLMNKKFNELWKKIFE